MANQLNFPDVISSTISYRPDRIHNTERVFISTGQKEILFGTSPNDVVEIWLYDLNGDVVGHVTLPPTDDALSLSTVIDVNGSFEYIDVDMTKLLTRLLVDPGRYLITANIFRNEVGSEEGEKLYIQEISSDRTELRLRPINNTDAVLSDIYEWVMPSVPKLYAQAVIDQTFGNTTEFAAESDVIQLTDVNSKLSSVTLTDINARNAYTLYADLVDYVLKQVRITALNNMAADKKNLNVQASDLNSYVRNAVDSVILDMKLKGLYDKDIFEVL